VRTLSDQLTEKEREEIEARIASAGPGAWVEVPKGYLTSRDLGRDLIRRWSREVEDRAFLNLALAPESPKLEWNLRALVEEVQPSEALSVMIECIRPSAQDTLAALDRRGYEIRKKGL